MKTYKTEIKPNCEQIQIIHQTFGNVRYVYNKFLEENFNRLDKKQKVVSAFDFSKTLNNDPNRPDWLLKSPSKAINKALMNANKALWDYLKGKKGKPHFKSKTQDNSFYVIEHIKVERHRIFLPKLKWVRLKEYGYIPDNIKSVTVSMKNGRYYVSCVCYESKDERIEATGEGIGIDFGLKNQFITQDVTIPSINKTTKMRKLEKRLKHQQRKLSKKYEHNMNKTYYKTGKKKGQLKSFKWIKPLRDCKNIQKAKLKVGKLHEKIARIRKDYNQKALQQILSSKPKFVVIEDLNIRGLMKNKHLSKQIAAAQWYACRLFLQGQCQKLGIELRLASRFYPSSKRCSTCGYKKTDLTLETREWTCPDCGTWHDRDINAAQNLQKCEDYKILTKKY